MLPGHLLSPFCFISVYFHHLYPFFLSFPFLTLYYSPYFSSSVIHFPVFPLIFPSDFHHVFKSPSPSIPLFLSLCSSFPITPFFYYPSLQSYRPIFIGDPFLSSCLTLFSLNILCFQQSSHHVFYSYHTHFPLLANLSPPFPLLSKSGLSFT